MNPLSIKFINFLTLRGATKKQPTKRAFWFLVGVLIGGIGTVNQPNPPLQSHYKKEKKNEKMKKEKEKELCMYD